MPKLLKKGIVTIAFDDAYLDTYRYAMRYLDRKKIKSTVAVPASFIGKTFEQRPLMGLKELKKIIKSGHEIASHTITHPNLLNLSQKDKKAALKEIADSKSYLQRRLGCKVTSFVFPYIKENLSRALILRAKKHYRSVRVTSDKPYFHHIPVLDPHDIVGFAVMKKHSVSYLNKLVDHARKKKLWLVEVFHLVAEKNTQSAHRSKPYRFFIHVDDFKKHIDYMLSKDILILPQKEAVKKSRHGV